MSPFLSKWLERRRQKRREAQAIEAALDSLFEKPELLDSARLSRRHRRRLAVLEVAWSDGGAPEEIVLGIIRHPKAHPLAQRGEEVLELLIFRPGDPSLEVARGVNLTRSRRQDPSADTRESVDLSDEDRQAGEFPTHRPRG